MKSILLSIFFIGCFSCSSKPLKTLSSGEFESPEASRSKADRGVSSQTDLITEDLNRAYEKYFLDDTFSGRLIKIEKLAKQVSFNLNYHGRANKNIFAKFHLDLKQQIQTILSLTSQAQAEQLSWLPDGKTDSKSKYYSIQIQALQKMIYSAQVWEQLRSFLSTKMVLAENDPENFELGSRYYIQLNLALSDLKAALANEPDNVQSLNQVKLGYTSFLAVEVRNNLHKFFERRNKKERRAADLFFQKIQAQTDLENVKLIFRSKEFARMKDDFLKQENTGSSEIDGFTDDVLTRVSTLFGLEMIGNLYGQLN